MPVRRRYTLTHNDLTGSLQLSVGREYNKDQVSGWYTRIVRDEVLAEWHVPQNGTIPSLNVYCHVSGEEMWPAPPSLRSFIFRREMKLVLDTIAYAERRLLAAQPAFAKAPIYVHLVSDKQQLNQVVAWGILGDRSSWQTEVKRRGGIFAEIFSSQDEPPSEDGAPSTTAESSLESLDVEEPEASQAAMQDGQAKSGALARNRSAIVGGSGPAGVGLRSSLGGRPCASAPGRPGANVVTVAAHRGSGDWSSDESLGGCEGARGVPVEAVLSDSPATK